MVSFKPLFRSTALMFLIPSLLSTPSQAWTSDHEEVQACGKVLRDLPEDLAIPFCASFAEIEDITSTFTKTISPIVVTVTPSAAPCTATVSIDPSAKDDSYPTSRSDRTGLAFTSPRTSRTSKRFQTISSTQTDIRPVTTLSSVIESDAQIPDPKVVFFTITTTVTSTVIIFTYSPLYAFADRDSKLYTPIRREAAEFCPDEGVPCRLAGFDNSAISRACSEFAKPTTSTVTKKAFGLSTTFTASVPTC